MISHILFNLFSRYNIGSFGFRKILAMLITVLIFGLLYLTVRFTGVDIPNYTRNLVMLVSVDLAGFLFLMWKRPKEPPKEEVEEEVVAAEVESKEAVVKDVSEQAAKVVKAEKTDELKSVKEEDSESNVVIKKIVGNES